MQNSMKDKVLAFFLRFSLVRQIVLMVGELEMLAREEARLMEATRKTLTLLERGDFR